MIKWRLGLDCGTNSLGWAALELDSKGKPKGLVDAGVRIFSDGRNPKNRQSNAVERRMARQMRKNRDRYLQRRKKFVRLLTEYGLMPEEELQRGKKEKVLQKLDPWELRVRGLDEELPLDRLARALFHLQQRRGFKSNRKSDTDKNEKGAVKTAIKGLKKQMSDAGARTLGEYLAKPRLDNPKAAHKNLVRVRHNVSGTKVFYNFYPTREMIEEEFDALWAAQVKHHGEKKLTPKARDDLREALFFQRPLKPQQVGKCTLNPKEERAPRALPSVQRLRIYQEINHLKVRLPGEAAETLSAEQRDKLVEKALNVEKLTFKTARNLLKLRPEVRFNIESERRLHLDGDKTAVRLAKTWGASWRDLPLQDQDEVVERLLDDKAGDEEVIGWLMEKHGLDADTAEAVADTPLPSGHGRFGCTAAKAVLAELMAEDVPTIDKAVSRATDKSHSDLDHGEGEVFDQLPYYGEILERHVAFGTGEPSHSREKRFGKLANPTVHVAMNQIRRAVNALTARYGPPAEIVVELARDLPLSADGKSDLEKQQGENKKRNDGRRAELEKLGQEDSYKNRLRLRLWEELNPDDPLDRRCPYTGEQISIERLFSSEVDIDHILPHSRTLDDSPLNKIVSVQRANRFKSAKSPYEAFHDSPGEYSWEDIKQRAANLPSNKSWRFGPDAMERYENEERDFLDRQLVDAQYLSRLTRTYLGYLYPEGEDRFKKIWVTPGRLTSHLRWAWGLDSVLRGHNRVEAEGDVKKNRNDHRHHAIDAIVVGLTDRGLLQNVATAAGRVEGGLDKHYLQGINDPWPGFREIVRKQVEKIIVSHKPDHGVQGALHNDTAYGIVESPDKKGRSVVVHRVPLSGMKKAADLKPIRDEIIRKHLQAETEGLSGKEFTAALTAAGERMTPPVRKVRILETLAVIPITDPKRHGEAPYKAYKGDANYCYDIWGGAKGKWTGEIVSRFDANQPGFDPKAETSRGGQPLIMRLRINDMLSVKDGGAPRKIMRVVKMTKGEVTLAEHFEAGTLKTRDSDPDDAFKYTRVSLSSLQGLNARRVRVSPAGRVK